MKVCDRCKNEMKHENNIKLDADKFEICTDCAKHIAKHIKTFQSKSFIDNFKF